MIKKLCILMLGIIIGVLSFATSSNAAQTIEVANDGTQITVKVNGNQINFDQKPYISNDRIMVPLRFVGEALGAQVEFDSNIQMIKVEGNNSVELTIGSSQALVNGVLIILDTPAVITGGRTMVPLRFIGEALGAEVYYSVIKEIPADVGEQAPQGNNIVNESFVAQQGDWIYYNSNDNHKLYKIRTDGSGRVCLNNDLSRYINVAGDWIYYSNLSDMCKIYKIRTDGSGRVCLNNDSAECVNVVSDWIYYQKYGGDYKLYKIRTDGSGKVCLNNESASYVNVAGDWIYYETYSADRAGINKIRTDGSGRVCLNNDDPSYINVSGDWIYFCNDNHMGKIYKIRTDGSGQVCLGNDSIYCLNVAGDWIYYVNESDNHKMYKMRTDGSERVCLNNDYTSFINVADDWIYYGNGSDEYKMYKMRTDGSERQLVN